MNITSQQAYSIMGVVSDCVLNKDGSITIAYLLKNPEPYALDEDKLQERHNAFYLALKDLSGVYYHKQDAFIKTKYDPSDHDYKDTFISSAEKEHFRGRDYLKHYSIISFTLINLESLEKAYQSNPFAWKEHLLKNDFSRLDEFFGMVEDAVSVLKNIYHTKIIKLHTDELKYYLFEFVNGFYEDGGIRDIKFAQRFTLGTATGSFMSISDENYMPENYTSIVDDDTIDLIDKNLMQTGRFDLLGIHLKANHVVNQIIFFEGSEKLRDRLHKRVIKHGQYRKFGLDINKKYEALKAFEEDVVNNSEVLVRAHFNIMLWDEDLEQLELAEKEVKSILKRKEFKYYMPSYEGLYNIFLGSIIGRNSKLSLNYFFLAELDIALTLCLNYSPFQDDDEGVLFTDRIFQIPKRVDVWSGGSKRLPARNAIVFASTGAGKSATTQNIVQQFIEQKVKTIVVEFGSSFKTLAELYKENSAHITYTSDTPLGINPFHIDDRSQLTPDKILTLSTIILKYWRVKTIDVNANTLVALQKIIRDYYDTVSAPHNFPSFYEHVKNNFTAIIKKIEIPEKYFDVESFLHVCSEFMPKGIYENVSAPADDTERKIRDNDFIVFELTEIKKDPFLISIVMTALFDTIENKILSDKSTRGVLIFDEYAETASLRDLFSGEDIHSTVAFAYQKFRKENGAIYTILQSPVQLPDNEYTNGIIANTQLLYVLPTTETVYQSIIKSFTITNKSHINLMKSINWNYETARPYNEVFIRFMDRYAVAHKLEFSREKFYSFQTDGEKWDAIQKNYKETGDIPQSIYKYMLSNNEKINPKMLNRYAPNLLR